jgi:hypothetical protein
MQKNILFGASELHRCEDDYEFDLECARLRLANQAPDQGVLAALLAIVGEFISQHGAQDLRHFLVLLKRQLDLCSRAQAAGLVAHYLDYGMRDDHVSHCSFADPRLAALNMHRPASRSSTTVAIKRPRH